jgi:hypothetical protein
LDECDFMRKEDYLSDSVHSGTTIAVPSDLCRGFGLGGVGKGGWGGWYNLRAYQGVKRKGVVIALYVAGIHGEGLRQFFKGKAVEVERRRFAIEGGKVEYCKGGNETVTCTYGARVMYTCSCRTSRVFCGHDGVGASSNVK